MMANDTGLGATKMVSPASEAQVRKLAHELWEQDGCPEVTADEYWHRAMRELAQSDQTMTPVEDMAADPSMARAALGSIGT